MSEDRILGIVLAGGEGTRLHPLIWVRSKPAVPFGDRYRIVNGTVSADPMSAQAITSPPQMPAIRLQAHPRRHEAAQSPRRPIYCRLRHRQIRIQEPEIQRQPIPRGVARVLVPRGLRAIELAGEDVPGERRRQQELPLARR